MRKVSRMLLVLFVMMCLTAGSSLAAETASGFVVKAFILDNETGGSLTIATRHIGVRLIIFNQSATAMVLSNLQLNRLMLTEMKQSLTDPDVTISWPLSYMNPYGAQTIVVDAGVSGLIKGTVLPVRKAENELTQERVLTLKSGYYFPSLTIDVYDETSGITSTYAVAVMPFEVRSPDEPSGTSLYSRSR